MHFDEPINPAHRFSRLFETPNPVLRRDLDYRERGLPGLWERYRGRIRIALVLMPIIGLIFLCAAGAVDLIYWLPRALHTFMVFHIIASGSDKISREFTDRNWDNLILTGVTARVIFEAKWLAVLRHTWGWLVTFWLARIPLLLVTCVYVGLAGIMSTHPGEGIVTLAEFGILGVLGLALVSLLISLDICCCITLSLAASAMTRNRSAALTLALIIRFAPVAVFGFAALASRASLFPSYSPVLALAESGVSADLVLLSRVSADVFVNSLLVAGMLLTMLTLSLCAGLIALRRAGASPQCG